MKKLFIYFRRLIRKLFFIRSFNMLVVPLLRIVAPIIPLNTLSKIPVNLICNIIINKSSFSMLSMYDDEIVSRLYFRGIKGYEYETISFVKTWSQTHDNSLFVAFDIGSNTGYFSLFIATLFPNSIVYAFEPYMRAYDRFILNIAMNKINNIKVFPIAAGKESIKVYFTDCDTHLGISTTNKRLVDSKNRFSQYREVDMISLDDFCENNKIKKMNLLKIDVEGDELEVLLGAKKSIVKYKPIIICECLNQEKLKNIETFAEEVQYFLFKILDSRNLILYPKQNDERL